MGKLRLPTHSQHQPWRHVLQPGQAFRLAGFTQRRWDRAATSVLELRKLSHGSRLVSAADVCCPTPQGPPESLCLDWSHFRGPASSTAVKHFSIRYREVL